jgi:C-terminal processing protease CtpA/Prc
VYDDQRQHQSLAPAASQNMMSSSFRQNNNLVTRTVMVPPGKLGIVIDTTLDGTVVHTVNPQSPLEGSIFSGDIIVAVDEVDTRAMLAPDITALMVQTAIVRRKLIVLSRDLPI